MDMKAAILYEINKPLVIDTVTIPELDIGQVLVKVHASGICHTQLDNIHGNYGADPYLPHLLGHGGSSRPEVDFTKYINLYQAGKLKLKELITHRFSFEKINDAIKCLEKGESCRAIIEF